jgi:hypothetical protein
MHFSGFRRSRAPHMLTNVSARSDRWSSLFFARNDYVINICEIITTHLIFENSFGEPRKVDPTFLSPSGIHTKQYVPKGVMKLVLALSSSFI